VKFRVDLSRNLYNTYQYIAKGLGLPYHTNIKLKILSKCTAVHR